MSVEWNSVASSFLACRSVTLLQKLTFAIYAIKDRDFLIRHRTQLVKPFQMTPSVILTFNNILKMAIWTQLLQRSISLSKTKEDLG